MGMFLGIDAAASGLTAERLRMDVISNSIANANTTRTQGGGAYHRRVRRAPELALSPFWRALRIAFAPETAYALSLFRRIIHRDRSSMSRGTRMQMQMGMWSVRMSISWQRWSI